MAGTIRRDADVVIVGGGPAGLSAALNLARAGQQVELLDEQPELGGQFFRQRTAEVRARLGDHRPAGRRLIAAVRQAGVTCRTGTTVWGAEPGTVLIHGAGSPVETLDYRSLVIATGAIERQLPFPGWQLPGVYTVGLAQHMAAGDGIGVGRRVVVAGSGPFLIPAAAELAKAGARVVAVIEAGHPYAPGLDRLGAALFPKRLAQLATAFLTLLGQGTRIIQGSAVVHAEPDATGCLAKLAIASTSDPDTITQWFEADALCVGFGFRPQSELPRLLGCRMQIDPWSQESFPQTDEYGRTSVDDVYIAGEVAGIRGSHSALATGELVAGAVLADRGIRARRSAMTAARWSRAMEERFALLSEKIYPKPMPLARSLLAAMPGSTQLCRCEGVCLQTVAEVDDFARTDLSSAKTATRAGMGPCQGRECGYAMAALLGTRVDTLNARSPIRPLPIAAVLEGES